MATNPPYIDVIALNFRPILVCRIATLILMPPHTVISNWFWYGYGSCDGIRIHTCELSISALVANQYSVLLSSAHHHHHRHCHHSEVEAYPISIQFNLNNRFSNLSYLIRMFNVQSLWCVCVLWLRQQSRLIVEWGTWRRTSRRTWRRTWRRRNANAVTMRIDANNSSRRIYI